jgi:hypothetical protein
MSRVFGTAIVTVAVAVNLRELSRRLDRGECDGMFKSPLCAKGSPVGTPASHFISSGMIPLVYANTLRNNTLLFTRAKAAWEADGDVFPFTQAQVNNAMSKCTLSDGTRVNELGETVAEGPFELMDRLGLEPCKVAL